ncbi:HAMP domain-containing protein [Roseomonas nepalensis]|uniref:histidine kinase n=1 Tax=Muricoccus nepalensis TaxID=1854500 RepID=A0A502G7M6_9PROT|nr:ATP-binding protein [Roseomonas nepalensis]TPG57390.1 HAMP domain-containing protein [Roseomonas nepalensis]
MVQLRRLLPETLATRTVAALLLGFGVLFGAMVGVHDYLLRHSVDWSTEELLSQRLATLLDAVAAAPPDAQDSIAQAISRPGLDIRRSPGQSAMVESPLSAAARRISERTESLVAVARRFRVEGGRFDPDTEHLIGIVASARLADGSWIDIEMRTFDLLSAELKALYLYSAAFGLALLVAVGLAARAVAAPVSALAHAVSRMDPAQESPALEPSGPREVRQLAEALDGMARRTRDAFRQRTLALGALSHDLMSPITRMRLRADDFPPEAREPLCRDLAEMETMVSDVLAYLRGGDGGEVARPLAIAALVHSITDEFADAGHAVEERGMDRRAVATVRRVALKRAVTNLVTNAFRHGERPWVEVEATSGEAVIRVGDRGPGIPAEDLPRVTEPFFRGDRARSSGGGSGLGLATARAIAESHGGRLEITSEPNRGTVSTIRLPARSDTPAQAPRSM